MVLKKTFIIGFLGLIVLASACSSADERAQDETPTDTTGASTTSVPGGIGTTSTSDAPIPPSATICQNVAVAMGPVDPEKTNGSDDETLESQIQNLEAKRTALSNIEAETTDAVLKQEVQIWQQVVQVKIDAAREGPLADPVGKIVEMQRSGTPEQKEIFRIINTRGGAALEAFAGYINTCRLTGG